MRSVSKFICVCLATTALSFPTVSMAAEDTEAREEIEALKQQVQELKELLTQQTATKQEVQDLKKEVKQVAKSSGAGTKGGDGWNTGNSSVHLSGYGSAGFATGDANGSRFNQTQFAPIFHYKYKDLAMLEAELEVEIKEDGTTSTVMEYLTIDVFLNDYMTLLAGKFLSPIGQFRQNYHPSWINKLPSAPVGFGHGEAAPLSDVGFLARGAFAPADNVRLNYAAYVANGPMLELNGAGDEIEHIEAEGSTANADGNFVYGGRVGIVPLPRLEIGVSGATGDAAVDEIGEPDRAYTVYGADFRYAYKDFDFRGEYINQEVGSAASSVAADGVELQAWYLQGAYKLPYNFEAVVRYSNFDSPHPDDAQSQWALGLNYLFANNLMAKFGYEINDGRNGEATTEDRYLAQLAFGF